MMNGDLQNGEVKSMKMAGMTRWAGVMVLGLVAVLGMPGAVRAGKLSWLDDVVHEVIVEAKAGGKGLVREVGGDGRGRKSDELADCSLRMRPTTAWNT